MATVGGNAAIWMKAGAAGAATKAAPLDGAARALMKPDHSPKEYADALVAAGHQPDAMKLMAFVLDRRQAVWWAVQCVKTIPQLAQPELAAAALAATAAWCSDPTDAKRRAAFTAGQEADVATPAGFAALAAFWADGSLAPPESPVVAPAPHLAPTAAANAAVLAAVAIDPALADTRYQTFLSLGVDVLAGKNIWGAAPPPPPVAPPPPPPGAAPPPPPPAKKNWY